MPYSIAFSPVFKLTLQRLCDFLSRKYSKDLAKKVKLEVRKEITGKLANNPSLGPSCSRLLDLGISGYRQLLVGKHNTVIYRVDDEAKEILVLLVFDDRQSIQKLLSDINLLV